MKNNRLVSIIIPIYNVEKYISKCIESCLKQTYKNVEIILVDDGSTDSSGKIADAYSKKNKNIIVFHKKNGGVSSARNYGIEKSHGEYICFVDSDDYLAYDFVEYMMKLAEENNSDFCFSKNCYTSVGQKQVDTDNIINVENAKATSILLAPYVEVGCWNKIYKKELLQKNNIRFSETLFYGEGLDFICRTSQLAKNIIVSEGRYYYYRKNNLDSATTSFKYDRLINGEKALLKIRDEIKVTSKELIDAWELHLVLFSINAIIAIKINKKNIDEYKTKLKKWKKNIKKYSLRLIHSNNVGLKQKLKIVIANICPQVLVYIQKKKNRKKIIQSI